MRLAFCFSKGFCAGTIQIRSKSGAEGRPAIESPEESGIEVIKRLYNREACISQCPTQICIQAGLEVMGQS